MHYYQFNIADYRKDTVHLTPLEHYIYRQLIDWYYLDESPIPKKTQSVMRRLCLVSDDEKSLISVLNDFFEDTENGWVHGRIEAEIEEYHAKKEKNRENGKKGGRPKKQRLTEEEKPKKTQSVILANPTESQKKPNQEPLTINQEPLTKEKSSARGSRLPADWVIPEDWKTEAKKIRPEWHDQHVLRVADQFKDYWTDQPGQKGVKVNWIGTWRNWCRKENTQMHPPTANKPSQPRKLMPLMGRPNNG